MSETPPSLGQRYEAAAFTFCKAGTLMLLLGQYALPVTSFCALILYVQAHRHGATESRCVLRYPLRIAAFWLIVLVLSLIRMIRSSS